MLVYYGDQWKEGEGGQEEREGERVMNSTNCIATNQKKSFRVESFSLNGINYKLYYSLLLWKVVLQEIMNSTLHEYAPDRIVSSDQNNKVI